MKNWLERLTQWEADSFKVSKMAYDSSMDGYDGAVYGVFVRSLDWARRLFFLLHTCGSLDVCLCARARTDSRDIHQFEKQSAAPHGRQRHSNWRFTSAAATNKE